MKKAIVSIIGAIGKNNEIGYKGIVPWNIPEDLKHFKNKTSGHVVIMGKKTFESIGRPLLNRHNIVITRNESFSFDGIIVAHSISDALEKAKELEKEEIFIIGGGQIYHETISLADKLYLTIVDGEFEGDAFFPDYSEFEKVVSRRESSDENFKYTFLELER